MIVREWELSLASPVTGSVTQRVERVGSRLTRMWAGLYTRPRMGTDATQPNFLLATTRLPDYRAPLASQPTTQRLIAQRRC